MDLLDQALETSQDKDGECSPTSSEAALVAAETCLVVEGGREVLSMVDEDEDRGGVVVGSDDEDDDPLRSPPVLHRVAPQQQVRRRQRRGIMLHNSASQDLIEQEQFEFRSDNGGGGPAGTVTYRVVQVAPSSASGNTSNDEMDAMPQIMSSTGNYSAPSGATGSGVQAVLTTSPLNGQFYVIGSPQDMFSPGSQRNIAPRSGLSETLGRGATRRDERRRATHNEVERRRRDKINNWIMKLGKIIPECSPEQVKQGQVNFEGQSKGGILAKACEYIVELRTANQRMADCMKENERLAMQVDSLRQQNEDLRHDTSALRSQLQQHGITPVTSISSTPQRARDLSS